MFKENLKRASVAQRMISVAGCVIGGSLVVVMAVLGAFGGYTSLATAGYSTVTIPFYCLVVLCGIGILCRVPYALTAAIGLCLVEIVVYLTTYLSTTVDVNFLFLVKIAVILSCTQLMVVVVENDDEPELEDEQPQVVMQSRQQRRVMNETDVSAAAASRGCAQPRTNRRMLAQGAPQPKNNRMQAPPAAQRRTPGGNAAPPQARR